MSSNTSSSKWGATEYGLGATVLLQRVAIIVSNGLLLSVLLYHRVLRKRKQYLVISLGTFADMLYGQTGAGATLQELVRQIDLNPGLFPSSECPVQLNLLNQAAMIGQQLASLGQCTDRLLAVSAPFYYFNLTSSFAKKMFIAIYGIVVSYWPIAQVGHTVMPVVSVHRCRGDVILHPYASLLLLLLMALPALTVLCMQPALYVQYKRSFSKVGATGNRQNQHQRYLAQQRKLTVTVALTAGAAFFTVLAPALFLLPLVLLSYGMPKGDAGFLIMSLFYNLAPIANVAIYCARQSEVRLGLVKMFRGQQLPYNFDVQQRVGARGGQIVRFR